MISLIFFHFIIFFRVQVSESQAIFVRKQVQEASAGIIVRQWDSIWGLQCFCHQITPLKCVAFSSVPFVLFSVHYFCYCFGFGAVCSSVISLVFNLIVLTLTVLSLWFFFLLSHAFCFITSWFWPCLRLRFRIVDNPSFKLPACALTSGRDYGFWISNIKACVFTPTQINIIFAWMMLPERVNRNGKQVTFHTL